MMRIKITNKQTNKNLIKPTAEMGLITKEAVCSEKRWFISGQIVYVETKILNYSVYMRSHKV